MSTQHHHPQPAPEPWPGEVRAEVYYDPAYGWRVIPRANAHHLVWLVVCLLCPPLFLVWLTVAWGASGRTLIPAPCGHPYSIGTYADGRPGLVTRCACYPRNA